MFSHAGFGGSLDTSGWPAQAASFCLHVGGMAILALLVPPAVADGEADRENRVWIAHVLARAASDDDGSGDGPGDARGDGAGDARRHGGAAAAASETPRRVSNPNTSQETPEEREAARKAAREAALREAAAFGMIGLLGDGPLAKETAPALAWDGVWTESVIYGGLGGGGLATFGRGGLDLSGTGEEGGGRGEGINIGGIGTIGHGTGMAGGQGFGNGHGRIGGSHSVRAPVIRCGPSPDEVREGIVTGCATQVNGRLPPETIQRIVRQSFGRFRGCYDTALRTNPGLQGRVAVKFVIDRSGQVAAASDAGSDLADASVVACVVRGFQDLSFPQPEGGIVTVVYPLVLTSAD
jgi:hypothetical protein